MKKEMIFLTAYIASRIVDYVNKTNEYQASTPLYISENESINQLLRKQNDNH